MSRSTVGINTAKALLVGAALIGTVVATSLPGAAHAATAKHGVAQRPLTVSVSDCSQSGGTRIYDLGNGNGNCIRFTGTGGQTLTDQQYPGTSEFVSSSCASLSTKYSGTSSGYLQNSGGSKFNFTPTNLYNLPGNFVNRSVDIQINT
jgi:hypothetical protein